jgi:8-oxo-dGTP pyrophosphatase MutT (NUDIX family)
LSEATVARLREALASTAELPRPVANFDLPLSLDKLLAPLALSALKEAAVLVPIMARPHGYTVLLTRRADTLRQHKGQISFPGGRRDEADDSITAAALREAHEEIGLPPQHVELLGWLDDYPTMTGYRITPVVGLIEQAFSPASDPGEVAEIFELPLSMIAGEDRFERKIFSRDGVNLPFYELNYGTHRIWGATAGILWDLRQRFLAR